LKGADDKTRAIAKLIADLDSPKFATREKATQALADLGAITRPFLEEALAKKPSLEARRRMQELMAKLPGKDVEPWLRDVRAIEALERIGTAEARKVLERVAAGSAAE